MLHERTPFYNLLAYALDLSVLFSSDAAKATIRIMAQHQKISQQDHRCKKLNEKKSGNSDYRTWRCMTEASVTSHLYLPRKITCIAGSHLEKTHTIVIQKTG